MDIPHDHESGYVADLGIRDDPDIEFSRELIRNFSRIDPSFETALREHIADLVKPTELLPVIYFTDVYPILATFAEEDTVVVKRVMELFTDAWDRDIQYLRDTVYFGFFDNFESGSLMYSKLTPTLREAYDSLG